MATSGPASAACRRCQPLFLDPCRSGRIAGLNASIRGELSVCFALTRTRAILVAEDADRWCSSGDPFAGPRHHPSSRARCRGSCARRAVRNDRSTLGTAPGEVPSTTLREFVSRRRQIIGAVFDRNAAQTAQNVVTMPTLSFPQSSRLQADRHRLPVRIRQHKVIQQVRELLASDHHFELAHIRKNPTDLVRPAHESARKNFTAVGSGLQAPREEPSLAECAAGPFAVDRRGARSSPATRSSPAARRLCFNSASISGQTSANGSTRVPPRVWLLLPSRVYPRMRVFTRAMQVAAVQPLRRHCYCAIPFVLTMTRVTSPVRL